jgi:hypothetical protein
MPPVHPVKITQSKRRRRGHCLLKTAKNAHERRPLKKSAIIPPPPFGAQEKALFLRRGPRQLPFFANIIVVQTAGW